MDSFDTPAWTNEGRYESVSARQVHALGEKDDILIDISTLGKSKNTIYIFEEAAKKHMKAIALLEKEGEIVKDMYPTFKGVWYGAATFAVLRVPSTWKLGPSVSQRLE